MRVTRDQVFELMRQANMSMWRAPDGRWYLIQLRERVRA